MTSVETLVEDAKHLARTALEKSNKLEDRVGQLEKETEKARTGLAALELRFSEFEDSRDYSSLSRKEKVGRVREHLFNKATDTNGKSAIDYNGVMWEVFDGEPGAKHCYTLMELAGEHPGFEYDESKDVKRVTCDADIAAVHATELFPENKVVSDGGTVQ